MGDEYINTKMYINVKKFKYRNVYIWFVIDYTEFTCKRKCLYYYILYTEGSYSKLSWIS